MNFIRYIFSFLYVRNWETGVRELSLERLYVLLAMGVLLVVSIGLLIAAHQPVEYIVEGVL